MEPDITLNWKRWRTLAIAVAPLCVDDAAALAGTMSEVRDEPLQPVVRYEPPAGPALKTRAADWLGQQFGGQAGPCGPSWIVADSHGPASYQYYQPAADHWQRGRAGQPTRWVPDNRASARAEHERLSAGAGATHDDLGHPVVQDAHRRLGASPDFPPGFTVPFKHFGNEGAALIEAGERSRRTSHNLAELGIDDDVYVVPAQSGPSASSPGAGVSADAMASGLGDVTATRRTARLTRIDEATPYAPSPTFAASGGTSLVVPTSAMRLDNVVARKAEDARRR